MTQRSAPHTHIYTQTAEVRALSRHICVSMCVSVFLALLLTQFFWDSIYGHFGKLIACSYSKVKTTNYFARQKKSPLNVNMLENKIEIIYLAIANKQHARLREIFQLQ